jgi:hypothetical protein
MSGTKMERLQRRVIRADKALEEAQELLRIADQFPAYDHKSPDCCERAKAELQHIYRGDYCDLAVGKLNRAREELALAVGMAQRSIDYGTYNKTHARRAQQAR